MESSSPRPAQSPVMVVDDDPDVLSTFRRVIERLGCPVTGFTDPLAAKNALDDGECPHLLIVDQHMTGMDGLLLAQYAMEVDPNIVTIVVTGHGDVQSAVDALRLGVVDYLLKPVDLPSLEFAVHRALRTRAQAVFHRHHHGRLREEVEEKSAELELQKARLESVTVASLSGLVHLLESRNKYFKGHSQAVSRLAMAMARELGLGSAEVEAVRIAGLLHDIGMISVPDEVLHKGEDLTSTEMQQVREHTRLAERVLRPFTHLGPVVDYVLSHHERLDGSGYPQGLVGREISLGAQVVGVADVYVALVESRSFREAVSPEEALATLRGAEGVWFATRVLDALEAVAGHPA